MTGTAGGQFTGLRNNRKAALEAAQRHSRLVRILRIALPASAGMIALGILGAIVFDPRVLLAELDAESMGISNSRIVMQRPRLTGYGAGSDGKPKGYEVTAERAEQDIANTNEVDLFELKAKMAMRDDGWAEIKAVRGHMNSKDETLQLFEKIDITSDLDDRAALTEANVDLAAGLVVSSKPVALNFQRADLTANSMQLFQNGERAVFTGNVKMTLKPDMAAPVAPAPEGMR
jgi:lipopolysaccharide export system protein LptC